MSLTIFRGFRLLRVFRLARNWDSFHKMMVNIGQTLKDIVNFFILLLIVVFVFSLLGVELFNNYVHFDQNDMVVSKDDPNGRPPTQNFDSFENSFVSVFVCLIGEDWQQIMHNYMRAEQNRLIPNFFFIILMIVGHLFLMNLFLAILLKNFELQSLDLEDEDNSDKQSSNTSLLNESVSKLILRNRITVSLRLKISYIFNKIKVRTSTPSDNQKENDAPP